MAETIPGSKVTQKRAAGQICQVRVCQSMCWEVKGALAQYLTVTVETSDTSCATSANPSLPSRGTGPCNGDQAGCPEPSAPQQTQLTAPSAAQANVQCSVTDHPKSSVSGAQGPGCGLGMQTGEEEFSTTPRWRHSPTALVGF